MNTLISPKTTVSQHQKRSDTKTTSGQSVKLSENLNLTNSIAAKNRKHSPVDLADNLHHLHSLEQETHNNDKNKDEISHIIKLPELRLGKLRPNLLIG